MLDQEDDETGWCARDGVVDTTTRPFVVRSVMLVAVVARMTQPATESIT